jgi:subtilisin family serine protease
MDCLGHGTHVAGIVGANPSSDLGFSGVVPNATLGMWKVFGCYDNVGDDVLIAAFNMAYETGADVITSSIGGNNGWSESKY